MKTKLFLTAFMTAWAVNLGLAQAPQGDRAAFARQFEALFLEGNRHYVETGNKARLLPVIDSMQTLVDQAYGDGTLTPLMEDELLVAVKMNKLWGDYHYLNSDDEKGSFAKAEGHFKSALAFTEDEAHARLRDVFYYQFVMHEELGQLYYKQGRYAEAYQEMKTADDRASFYSPSEDEQLDILSQLAMCEARVAKFDSARTSIQTVIDNYRDKDTERYGEALRKKAKILMLQQENTDTGMADPTGEALKCYKDYFALKKADALQNLGAMSTDDREAYWMRIRPFVVDCYRIEAADPAFLYDVTLFSKALLLEYARSGKPEFHTWQQVQKKLKADECAVEFVQYEKRGEKHMAALVLKQKGKPRFVGIGSVGMIENTPLLDGGTVIDAMTEDCSDMKNALYSDSTIFTTIWTPDLLNAIGKDTQRLYFAPDGIFHQLAIEYMLPDAPWLTSLTAGKLYRLTSTRQLLAKATTQRNGRILACGGIDFNNASPSETAATSTGFPNDEQAYQYLKSMRFWWSNLPGTKDEIDSLQALYDSDRITLLTDSLASEACFTQMASQYPIVHLATHGYFGGLTPEGTDLIPAGYDASLSQNILAFAGINASLFTDGFDASKHDGILSAREIEHLDLSGVELIVLSACQSGLGYLTSDGIYGLQRGLKNAGAKGMIVSLWSVDDEATALLMQSFYTHLQTEDAHTAFLHAREELIATGREATRVFDSVKMKGITTSEDFSLPQFCDAFILIDIK